MLQYITQAFYFQGVLTLSLGAMVWPIVRPNWKTSRTDREWERHTVLGHLKSGVPSSLWDCEPRHFLQIHHLIFTGQVFRSLLLLLSESLCFQSGRVSWCAPLPTSHWIELLLTFPTWLCLEVRSVQTLPLCLGGYWYPPCTCPWNHISFPSLN